MKQYTIELPRYILHFSLPEEIIDQGNPIRVDHQFSPLDPIYFRNGFREIATASYDFNGPFWAGTYGGFDFGFSVQKCSREYKGDITTLDGLDRYVQWWSNNANPDYDFHFDRDMINGVPWVRRWHYTFDQQSSSSSMTGRQDLEIYSQPINKDMFLEAHFIITESVPGSAKKWKDKADAMRAAIKATITLEPKVNPTGGQPKHGEDPHAEK